MGRKIGIVFHDKNSNREFLRRLLKSKDIEVMYLGANGVLDIFTSGQQPEILNPIKYTTELTDMFSMDFIFFFAGDGIEIDNEILWKLNNSFKGVLYLIPEIIQDIPALLKGNNLSNFTILHFPDLSTKPLVEIQTPENYDPDKIRKSLDLLEYLGLSNILLERDIGRQLIDRLQLSFINSALHVLEDGFSVSTVDALLRFRLGFGNGIFQLADLYGIDKIYEKYKIMGFGVPHVIDTMYKDKKFGKSSGTGFYDYSNVTTLLPDEGMYKLNPYDLISPVINAATALLEISDFDSINSFFTVEYGSPTGIFAIADGIGIKNIVENLDKNYKKYGDILFKPGNRLMEMVDNNTVGVASGSGFYEYNYSESDFGPVEYYSRDRYAYIVMNRPEALNALNGEMWKGLRLALDKANSDGNVTSIVITGSGRSFSAGDDIRMMSEWNNSIDASIWLDRYANPLIDAITSSIKPVISLVDGIAFGGGCEINMLFDIVIASDRSVFSVPEGLIGALPPVASSYGIALMGRKLFRYLLTSEWINANQANSLGIVDVVVSREQLPFMVYEFTEKIRKSAPMSIINTKKLINACKENFKDLERLAGSYLVINAGSEDFKKGQKAFLNKEKVEWKGK
jgi:enoyl-CoA hydratase/3-hydroxyacyl-CoA dehydrogenase